MFREDKEVISGIFPPELQQRDQWICWKVKPRADKDRKIPVAFWDPTIQIDFTDADNWTDLETAKEAAASHDTVSGIGFVFAADGPFAGVDLDDCRDPETREIDPLAREIVDRLDSFTEVSPSGAGLHIYVKGAIPDGGNKKGNVEMYDRARFFTVTGSHVDGTPKYASEAPEALHEIHSEYVAKEDDRDGEGSISGTATDSRTPVDLAEVTPSDAGNPLSDEQVLEVALDADDPKFRRLWNGDFSNYPSQSEADLALCNKLAFYTGGDADQMDCLFRQSELYRKKWTEVHYANGDTYGERTIAKAIRDCEEAFSGSSLGGSDILEEHESDLPTDGGRPIVSDPTILGVVEALRDLGDASSSEIEDHPEVDRSVDQVRRAINHLEELGLINWESSGRSIRYQLTEDG